MTKNHSPSYQKLEDLHKEKLGIETSVSSRDLLLEFVGPFDESLVDGLSQQLEATLLQTIDERQVVKRSFAILIEALQNTKLHGDNDESGVKLLSLAVTKSEEDVRIRFMNMTTDEKAADVQRRVGLLNAMDKVELKQYYMDTMTNGERSSKGGAGLGLITMVMKSKNPVKLETYSDAGTDRVVLETTVSLNRKKSV